MYNGYPETKEEHGKYVLLCLSCGCRHPTIKTCSNRFCDYCRGGKARTQSQRMNWVLERAQVKGWDTWYLLTLTVPGTEDIKAQYRTLLDSFRRLRNRKLWKRYIRGGVYNLEVKRGRAGDWHVHIHCIYWGRSISYAQLRHMWKSSCHEMQWQGQQGTNLKKIVQPVGALRYVLGYIGKNDMSMVDQVTAARGLRSCQLWGTFGVARGLLKGFEREKAKCSECGSSIFFPEELFEGMYPDDYAWLRNQYCNRLEQINAATARASPVSGGCCG